MDEVNQTPYYVLVNILLTYYAHKYIDIQPGALDQAVYSLSRNQPFFQRLLLSQWLDLE